jgi:hypothetical protein
VITNISGSGERWERIEWSPHRTEEG